MNSTFNKRLTLILSIVSAAVGAGFGLMGQMWYVNDGSDSFFYTDVDLPLGVGIGLGMVLGFASGWFYSAGISVIAGRYKQRGPIVGWGTLLGIVVGLGCSTVFHLILMILYRTNGEGIPMLAGAITSGPAGFLIGVVFSSIWPINAEQNSD